MPTAPLSLVRMGEGGVGSPGAVRICSLEIQGSRDSSARSVLKEQPLQRLRQEHFLPPTAIARNAALTSCWRILWIGDARKTDRWRKDGSVIYLSGRRREKMVSGMARNRVASLASTQGSNRLALLSAPSSLNL